MMSGLLKRKFSEVEVVEEDDPCYSSSSPSSLTSSGAGWDSDGESSCFSDTLDSTPSNPGSPATPPPTILSILKKSKRARKANVQFDQVEVFFFPRCQGFTSVPSRGGCSLGMLQRHSAQRSFTLAEFAVEQRHSRREKLKNRIRQERLEALRQKLTKNGTMESEEADRLTLDDIPESEIDLSGVNMEDGASFLHPYASKQRHALLKAAGVKKIDKEEKRQLHELRLSRENCGCDCQTFCEPETCSCSLAGIKCQMDHSSFPCGCSKECCANPEGRVEFNSGRVQTHYIHTIMKLELERRLEEHSNQGSEHSQSPPSPSPQSPPSPSPPSPQYHQHHSADSESHSFQQLPTLSLSLSPPSLVADIPAFHFSSDLTSVGENSCSSDMTDTSSSSGQSEEYSYSYAEPGESQAAGERSPLDVDENGLTRILSFTDTDSEDANCGLDNARHNNTGANVNDNDNCQRRTQTTTTTTSFSIFGSCLEDNDNNTLSSRHKDLDDNRTTTSMSELLDENANQGNALFHSSCGTVPNTPSPSYDHTSSYNMDLSLSSESDLEFFDGFPCLGPSSLYNSLKEYEPVDNFFHFQLPSYPSLPQGGASNADPGTCLLESLIGLGSESVPEPPPTFTDNQMLEEAMKLSVMEPVKV
ncbi:cysteine/serine-rich nuclear protein 1b [Engraulis encrasicolus]|uniref:cysteine/serine-rich nuclear protein 1b n=1 Tax=Engraulis encrasicolus TaxID=184585 RepID=UPI002FD67A1F